jgi:hypothetical protein
MKINTLISKQTTLILILAISFATLFLPLTIVQAATLSDGMDATEIVFGSTAADQDFDGTGDTEVSNGVGRPFDSFIDETNHRFFVAMYDAPRVLIYNLNLDNTFPDYVADYVLGQDDFVSDNATLTRSGLRKTSVLAYDSINDYLFVADIEIGSRVLVYNLSGGITNGMNASYVLGQDDFISEVEATNQNGVTVINGLTYDEVSSRLFVSDSDNSRILIYNLSGGITNGMNASYVLGQDDFISTEETATQNRLDRPFYIKYIPELEYLFVNDAMNFRTVVYDLSGVITNGMNASFVLGQADFISAEDDGPTASSFTISDLGEGDVSYQTFSYDSVNQKLFVGDIFGSRVLVFDISSGLSSNMDASYVLGQDDLISSYQNNPDGDPTQSNFSLNSSLQYLESNESLYVSDISNARVLRFDLSATVSSSTGLSYTQPPLCKATITPNTITAGEETTLSWNTTWPTDRQSNYYTKVPGEGLYSSSVNSISIQPKHTTTYRLATFNLWGANFCEATVEVLDTEGEEVTSERNSILTASAAGNSFFRPIISFFAGLFVR